MKFPEAERCGAFARSTFNKGDIFTARLPLNFIATGVTLMSKKFARSSLCALGMTIMTAQAAEPPKAIGDGEGRLDIIAWPGYIERGQTDKNYDWVTQFEKETGCAVNVKTAATSDEMVSLMAKGGYDLVTASGDASCA
jgi:putative spermidine/putrescine transport system substrate-binding protein